MTHGLGEGKVEIIPKKNKLPCHPSKRKWDNYISMKS